MLFSMVIDSIFRTRSLISLVFERQKLFFSALLKFNVEEYNFDPMYLIAILISLDQGSDQVEIPKKRFHNMYTYIVELNCFGILHLSNYWDSVSSK